VLVLLPGGRALASGHRDGSVKLWDSVTGANRGTLGKHAGEIRALASTADGRTLASGSWDGTVKLWDVAARKEKGSFLTQGGKPIASLVLAPEGQTLAVVDTSRSVQLFEGGTGRARLLSFRQPVLALAVAFRGDGKVLAIGGASRDARNPQRYTGKVVLWDLGRFQEGGAWTTAADVAVTRLAFAPDGNTLAVVGSETLLELWDPATGRRRASCRWYGDLVSALAFAPGGKTLAVGRQDRTVQLWDTAGGQLRAILRGHVQEIAALAFSLDGRTLVTASKAARQTRSTTGEVRRWTACRERATLVLHYDPVLSLTLGPRGRTLTSAGTDGTVRRLNLVTGREQAGLRAWHSATIFSIAASRDGKWLASGSYDQLTRVWNATTGRLLASLKDRTGHSHAVAFSPDGRVVATGSCDRTITLHDVATKKLLATLSAGTAQVMAVAFSPDGKTLASGGGTNDPKVSTSWSDGQVKLWDVARRTERALLRGHTSLVRCLAFSPDSQLLATGGVDQTVKLWEVSTGRLLTTVPGHTGSVHALAFTPDGKGLASAGGEGLGGGEIKLWDVATHREVASLRGHNSLVTAVAFTPDGRQLVSGDAEGTIKTWDMSEIAFPD
jgi:WD40 repeat protein